MDDQSPQKPAGSKKASVLGTEQPQVERDLSPEIERAMAREPLDRVRCVHVYGNYYRCNWWSRMDGGRKPQEPSWGELLMDTIRKSRFVTASVASGTLVIKEVGSDGTLNENPDEETAALK